MISTTFLAGGAATVGTTTAGKAVQERICFIKPVDLVKDYPPLLQLEVF